MYKMYFNVAHNQLVISKVATMHKGSTMLLNKLQFTGNINIIIMLLRIGSFH